MNPRGDDTGLRTRGSYSPQARRAGWAETSGAPAGRQRSSPRPGGGPFGGRGRRPLLSPPAPVLLLVPPRAERNWTSGGRDAGEGVTA